MIAFPFLPRATHIDITAAAADQTLYHEYLAGSLCIIYVLTAHLEAAKSKFSRRPINESPKSRDFLTIDKVLRKFYINLTSIPKNPCLFRCRDALHQRLARLKVRDIFRLEALDVRFILQDLDLHPLRLA